MIIYKNAQKKIKKIKKMEFPQENINKRHCFFGLQARLMSSSKIDIYLENDGCEGKSGGGGEDMEVGQDTYFLY